MNSKRTYKIRDIGRVVTGRTPSSAQPECFGDEIPFVTPTDMDGRRTIERPERFLSKIGAERLASILVPEGVAISCIGWQMGKDVLINEASATNQQINTVIPNVKCVDKLYLYCDLFSRREEIFRLGAGGSRTPILNKSGFENLEVQLPSLPEQRAIAHILGTLDDKIELNRKMNETMEALARAIFKSWFIDFGHSDGEMPDGWALRGLDTVATFLNGLALQKFPPTGDAWLPVIKIAQPRTGTTDGADRASADIAPEYVVTNGDVLFSWSGSLVVTLWCGGRVALNQHLFKVTSTQFPKWFYYLWIRHHLPDFQEIASSKATTMGHIQRHHLSEATVLVPTEPELMEMDRVLRPMVERIISNNLESSTLTALRDSLLPKLLSGEIRVLDAEKQLEAVL